MRPKTGPFISLVIAKNKFNKPTDPKWLKWINDLIPVSLNGISDSTF
jgi:hypothetical protein